MAERPIEARRRRGEIRASGRAVAEDDDPPAKSQWKRLLLELLDRFKEDLFFIVIATVAAIVRAMGVTVESGQTGLRFSFGRANKELEPGFHLLFPFIQTAKVLPTRSRTLDLPAQRVMSSDGLVYLVDANLVYRITDVRRALIQIDDLERGMTQMLGLGVQEVLRKATGAEVARAASGLDGELETALARRLEPWGVSVEGAGFPSIRPSPRTLRITQLGETVEERRRKFDEIERQMPGADARTRRRIALTLVGTRAMPRSRAVAMRRFVRANRRVIGLHRKLQARGWNGVQIKEAEIRILDHLASQRRPGVFVR